MRRHEPSGFSVWRDGTGFALRIAVRKRGLLVIKTGRDWMWVLRLRRPLPPVWLTDDEEPEPPDGTGVREPVSPSPPTGSSSAEAAP